MKAITCFLWENSQLSISNAWTDEPNLSNYRKYEGFSRSFHNKKNTNNTNNYVRCRDMYIFYTEHLKSRQIGRMRESRTDLAAALPVCLPVFSCLLHKSLKQTREIQNESQREKEGAESLWIIKPHWGIERSCFTFSCAKALGSVPVSLFSSSSETSNALTHSPFHCTCGSKNLTQKHLERGNIQGSREL